MEADMGTDIYAFVEVHYSEDKRIEPFSEEEYIRPFNTAGHENSQNGGRISPLSFTRSPEPAFRRRAASMTALGMQTSDGLSRFGPGGLTKSTTQRISADCSPR